MSGEECKVLAGSLSTAGRFTVCANFGVLWGTLASICRPFDVLWVRLFRVDLGGRQTQEATCRAGRKRIEVMHLWRSSARNRADQNLPKIAEFLPFSFLRGPSVPRVLRVGRQYGHKLLETNHLRKSSTLHG